MSKSIEIPIEVQKFDKLIESIKGNDENTAKDLIRENRNIVNFTNSDGETPLHIAVKAEQTNIEIVKLLLLNRCNPNAQTVNGRTPLHIECSKENSNNSMTVQLLINHSFSMYIPDRDGKIPLHYAVMSDNFEAVNFMTDKDPNIVKIRDKKGHIASDDMSLNTMPNQKKITENLKESEERANKESFFTKLLRILHNSRSRTSNYIFRTFGWPKPKIEFSPKNRPVECSGDGDKSVLEKCTLKETVAPVSPSVSNNKKENPEAISI